MRFIGGALLGLMVACGGKVEGHPGAAKADKLGAVSRGECTEVRGSKYAVCGIIDGSFGPSATTDEVGTTYAVRGAGYAQ